MGDDKQDVGCPCSGCTDYPADEPRCPECGYTTGDAEVFSDHYPPHCAGVIPARQPRTIAKEAGRG